MNAERFKVCQFFPDGTHEFVRIFVPAKEAASAFRHYSDSVGAAIGTTRRVIATDDVDRMVAEWIFNKGVTLWPAEWGVAP